MTLPEIHISDVRTFRSCRRKWDWTSLLRRGLEPIVTYAPFFTGRAIHESFEDYHAGKKPLLEAFDEYVKRELKVLEELNGSLWPQEQQTLDEQVTLARALLMHYLMWQEVDDGVYRDSNLEFLELEYDFSVPARTPDGNVSDKFSYGGKFDGFVHHIPSDTYWLWETKTTRSIKEFLRSLPTDEQSALYLYAARQVFDKPIEGVIYNLLRKKAPTVPNKLKSGLLSKASNIDTTPFFYKYCIQSDMPDWGEDEIEEFYGDILATLQPKTYEFFLRYPIKKTDVEIANIVNGIYQTGLEMINPDTAIYPCPGWLSCNYCNFKSPCLTMTQGQNYEVLLNAEYRPRDNHRDPDELRSDED